MALTRCGMCNGDGGWEAEGHYRRCLACIGTGMVSDDGLLSDVAKQRLEDETDERADRR